MTCSIIALLTTTFLIRQRTSHPPAAPAALTAQQARVIESFGKLPLSFEANQGQVNSQVKFLSRGHGYNLFLTANEAALVLQKADGKNQPAALRMQLIGANPEPRVSGVDQLPGRSNYFLGDDPKQWKTGVANYAKVKYEGVYPGVDLVYYGNQQQLEYDFVVAPGTDPKRIKLDFAGARKLRLDEGGDLIVETEAGELRQHRPVVYQEFDGRRQEVAGGYAISGESEAAFEIGEYDAGRALVIDPVLSYSTLLGDGTGGDDARDIAVDAAGNAYVTGRAEAAPGFPATPGAISAAPEQQQYAGHPQFVFVTKFNPQGNQLIYSALIGATRGIEQNTSRGFRYTLINEAFGLTVDAAASAYVTGRTLSANFPTTPGAFKTTYDGRPTNPERNNATDEAFVLKLNAAGDALIYSTLLGGNKGDTGRAVVADAQGAAYITGLTDSANFPATPGAFQPQSAGGSDAFVTKLNPAGSALIYSTFLSSGGTDIGYGLAVDASGNVYATGVTSDGYTGTCCPRGPRFPFTAGAYQTSGTLGGAYVVKLNPAGGAIYSALLGGAERTADNGPVVAIDAAGHAYVTGFARSPLFPTTPGAYRRTGLSDNPNAPRGAGFVTKFAPDGASLVYSTLLGEPNEQPNLAEKEPNDIAVDASGNVYVTGRQFGGLVEKLNAVGSALIYSYRFPAVEGKAIAIDGQGGIYFAGIAWPSFFATPGAYRQSFANAVNVRASFAAKISETSTDGVPLPLPGATPTPTPSNTDPKSIGGRITDQSLNGVAQVEMKLFSNGALLRTETTSAFGYYAFPPVPYGGDYTVVPAKTGYSFNPPQHVFENLTNHADASFTAVPATTPTPTPTPGPSYTIIGRVTNNSGQGVAGVTVNLDGALQRAQQTDSQGRYSFTNVPLGGPYTITASYPNAALQPEGYAFSTLRENRTADFSTLTAAHVSAASYLGAELAVESIVSAFGLNLATAAQAANSNPLPTQLAGTTVKLLDSLGVERLAPLFFVSPTQINYLIPPGMASGYAVITVTNSNGVVSLADTRVAAVAPSIFTTNSSGTGLISAIALRVKADGSQQFEPVARYDAARQQMVAVPIDLGPDLGSASDQVYLIFFGTGFRGRSGMSAVSARLGGVNAQVVFAGAQDDFAGLDQCNLRLPRALIGRGEVGVAFDVDGKTANGVKVWIK